jgi:arylsulfatase A-like enzyme
MLQPFFAGYFGLHRASHALTIALACFCAVQPIFAQSAGAEQPPNIVLIFCDDLGYGDIGCFSETEIRTPHIDRLASQGCRFTNFYVSQAVCTASRASLMSGCYANRVGLAGALNHTSRDGIAADEELMPELLKRRGYATGMFGKWHLGLPPYFSPLKNGFDEWMGIPYSNDNSKFHPVLSESMPPLPWFDGETVIDRDLDQAEFTKRLTERAVEFIESHVDEPFFLYVPHIMPHVPIFASEAFAGTSARGLYGDVVEELDWSVGQIVNAIDRLGLAENTLVLFTSDNGPFLSYGSHAGSNGVFREGKLTTFEGGVRMPTVMRWTGRIAAGSQCDVPLMTIDLLPTFCRLSGADLPSKKIDGMDASEVILGRSQQAPQEGYVFFAGSELQAIRGGRWKLHFPHRYLTVLGPTRDDGKPAGWGELEPRSITDSGIEGIASRHGYRVADQPLALYDLVNDPGENRNVAEDFPEVIERLERLAETYRKQLGDALRGVDGNEVRMAGTMDGVQGQ